MAKLAKEAITTRRVLESLFRYFDNENLWSLQSGLALPVLKDVQLLMDSSGSHAFFNSHCLSFFLFPVFILFFSNCLFSD